jgi:hypothetical protein
MSYEGAVRWQVRVSKETDLSLRSFLDSQGMKRSELSRFVEQAVLRQVFQQTVDDIHVQNSHSDPVEVEAEIFVREAHFR